MEKTRYKDVNCKNIHTGDIIKIQLIGISYYAGSHSNYKTKYVVKVKDKCFDILKIIDNDVQNFNLEDYKYTIEVVKNI